MMIASPADASVLAKVNQTPISDHAVRAVLGSYLRQIGHQNLPAQRMSVLRKEVLKKLIEEELLYQDALRAGLPVSDEEIKLGVAEIRKRFESNKAYEEALENESLNPEDIRAGVYRSLLIQKRWKVLSVMGHRARRVHLEKITGQADIQIYQRKASGTKD